MGRNYDCENTTYYYSLTKGLHSLKKEKKIQTTAKQYLVDFTDFSCWLHCSSVKQTYLTFRQHTDHQPFFPSPPSLINPKTERRIEPPWELFLIHLFRLQGKHTASCSLPVCAAAAAPHISHPGEGRLLACGISPKLIIHLAQAQAQLCSPAQPSSLAGSASPGLMSA